MLVLLDGSLEPLLTVFCKVRMGKERYCEWNIWFWWGQVGVLESLIDDV